MAINVRISSQELDTISTNTGRSLRQISVEKPVMVVFLRHLGCSFCREALRDIATLKKSLPADDQEIVLIHMETNSVAGPFFDRYGLGDCQHIADPDQELYRRFGLVRGSFSQLFGFRTMIRGFQAGISRDQLGGAPFGDAFQMPGIFVIHHGEIVAAYVHKSISDRPDYRGLLECCITDKNM